MPAYEVRISDWSSDVCSSDLLAVFTIAGMAVAALSTRLLLPRLIDPAPRDFADSRMLARMWSWTRHLPRPRWSLAVLALAAVAATAFAPGAFWQDDLSKLTPVPARSEEHTSELQSLMRISYAVFC